MTVLLTNGWQEYELLDSGNGRRLERFGAYVLSRPDPQCLWLPHLSAIEWQKADALFDEGKEKSKWLLQGKMKEKWQMAWQDVKFYVKLTPFKHTGVFPEQLVHWKWLEERIKKQGSEVKNNKKIKVLNLFGYTGIASLVCAAAGAEVTHVDGSYPTIGWARENQALSGLSDRPIRWLLDDCLKFVQREVRRGARYDGIIMDPPAFGHGPKGERWEFSDNFPTLLRTCQQLLSDQPLFVLINAYAISASAIMLQNMLEDSMQRYKGNIEAGEVGLQEKKRKRVVSTGIFARWS